MDILALGSGLVVGISVTWSYWYIRYKSDERRFFTDQLTGLKNSYYFENKANNLMREGNVAALIDIDDFKKFNARFGYEGADVLLKLFVLKVLDTLPIKAEVIRYKFGDEFLVVLIRSSTQDLTNVITAIRFGLKQNPLILNGISTDIEFSAGVTTIQKGEAIQSLTSRLSLALQRAKQNKNVTEVVFVKK